MSASKRPPRSARSAPRSAKAAARGAKAAARGAKAAARGAKAATRSAKAAARSAKAAARSAKAAARAARVRISLELVVDSSVRAQAPWRVRLRREVARMLTAAARRDDQPALEASLRLTDDDTIHALNRDFRHKDKPTDVLAFAQREGQWAGVGPELLGDIVISLPTARRQAKHKTAEGVFTEVRFLAAHGLCHLLGYDHNTDEEERVMNERMAALLAQAKGLSTVHPA